MAGKQGVDVKDVAQDGMKLYFLILDTWLDVKDVAQDGMKLYFLILDTWLGSKA